MQAKYQYRIAGRSVFVFDDVIPDDEVKAIGGRFVTAAFVRDEFDGPETKFARAFSTEVDWATFDGSHLKRAIKELVPRFFPSRELELERVHCNLTVYGDATFPHFDCRPERDDVNALYFANAEWKREWGGEITFYNEHGDASHVITPRPGRLALFEGAIEHRVGVPLRSCYEPRLTLACKFKVPGARW